MSEVVTVAFDDDIASCLAVIKTTIATITKMVKRLSFLHHLDAITQLTVFPRGWFENPGH